MINFCIEKISNIIFYCTLMFFIGSIPFGLIWSTIFCGKNLKHNGSGNIGTSNAWRVNGKLVGFLTSLCDIGKGYLCSFFCGDQLLIGMFAILGHMYSPWSGGKGVATFFGVCVAIFGFYALIPMILWILLVAMKFKPKHASYFSLFSMCFIALNFSFLSFLRIFLISIMIIKKHIIADLLKRVDVQS